MSFLVKCIFRKLSLEGFYVARMLHFKIISFGKFYHVGRCWFNDIFVILWKVLCLWEIFIL